MKNKSFSICRYGFPKDIVEKTTLVKVFNDNGSYKRMSVRSLIYIALSTFPALMPRKSEVYFE